MIKKTFIPLIAWSLFILSCNPVQQDLIPYSASFTTYYNILYGTDTIQQTMDVALPNKRDRSNTAVVILLHGGSWVTGNKTDWTSLGLDTFFTSNDCAVVNMNYRLDLQYPYPAALDDIATVISYLKGRVNEWKINPDRICLMGRSSGAHLALQYAYSRNADKSVKAVIDAMGPADFTDTSIIDGPLGVNVTVMLGPYIGNQQKWHDASPIFYVSGAVPTAIFEATADQLVYPVQSEMLSDSLTAHGVPSILFHWVGNSHGWSVDRWRQFRDPTMTWIKHYL